MIKEKISSQEIIDLVASKASVSKRAAEEFLKVMIATIEESLVEGEAVKIKNFGTFKLQWNEPRKSVNVQTGEEIMLAGYHKVTFTPDIILRDLVNEPFAHLEPIKLDAEKNEPIFDPNEEHLDPLRVFTEQASEIKSLISEIQALSPSVRAAEVEEKNSVEPLHIESFKSIEEIRAEINEYQIKENAIDKKSELVQGSSKITHNQLESDIKNDWEVSKPISETASELESSPYLLESNSYLTGIKPKKKWKVWLTILIAFLLFLVAGSSFTYFYKPARDFATNTINNCKTTIVKGSENVSITEMLNTISKWFAPKPKKTPVTEIIVVPKDTSEIDSISQKLYVDSLQLLFDNPRVYKEFIGAERIKQGSRLTLMSKRYYGNKNFWVYIYEANKEKIPNPDQIAKGTLIQIPKLDTRLINANDPRCIEKAKELHDKYVKK